MLEPWERILWSSSPALPLSMLRPGTQYVLTDVRVAVRRRRRTVQEIALDDIASVRLTQNWYQRLAGTSTVRIQSTRGGRSLELANVHHGPQLALILQLLATERLGATLDDDFVKSALGPNAPRLLRPHRGLVWGATLAFVLTFVVVRVARHDTLAPISY